MDKKDFIKKHFESMTDSDIGLKLGMSEESVRSQRRRMGLRKGRINKPAPVENFDVSLLGFLKSRKTLLSVEELSDHFNCGVSRVKEALERLKKLGHNIEISSGHVGMSKDIAPKEPTRIDIESLKGQVIRFGFTSDNHLGSKYARMDVLNALFDIWAEEGITTVYQAGNMIEGEARFNTQDVAVFTLGGQVRHFVETWPKRKGIKTYYVTGDDHEGWYVQREGINIGQVIEDTAIRAGRDDLVFLGHMEHDIVFRGTRQDCVLRIIHAGGGSSYATSYSAQKIVESYQGGEKPQVLLIGHYHKAEYGYPREVHCIQGGCTEDQSTFMRKRKIAAHVGGWIVEMTLNKEGKITRFKTEWIPFYDLGYYNKNWKYQFTPRGK